MQYFLVALFIMLGIRWFQRLSQWKKSFRIASQIKLSRTGPLNDLQPLPQSHTNHLFIYLFLDFSNYDKISRNSGLKIGNLATTYFYDQ